MSDILSNTQVGSYYRPDPPKTLTHELPSEGPRDLAPKAAPQPQTEPRAMTLRERIIKAIRTIGRPCTVREIYEQGDFIFPVKDMTSRLASACNVGHVTKEKIDGVNRYSLPLWSEEKKQIHREPNARPAQEKKQPPQAETQIDPLLAVIQGTAPAPRITNAELHAKRLRALATWPDMHDDIALWLCALAAEIEGNVA